MLAPAISRFWIALGRRFHIPRSAPDDLAASAPLRTPALDWQKLEELFTAALEVPAEQRPALLDRVGIEHPGLRSELESLIAAHGRASMLDRELAPLFPLDSAQDEAEPRPSLERSAPHYELLEKAGGGGMGVVYRARDRRLGRVVALKFMPPHMSADEEAKQRFVVESRAAAALDHPNVCTIYEVGESDEGQLFIAMAYYDGDTLKRRLAGGPLSVADVLEIGVQVASGLAKAHSRDIVHRDIKPANIMITVDGVVKIVDFGVAKLADVSVIRPGLAIGTVAYMSPEQARGEEIDGRSDLWSLGVVLYEMLTGQRPFAGDHDDVLLSAITTDDPAPISRLRPGIPPALEDVVQRALAKRRDDRYATALEMAAAIDALRTPARVPRPHPAVFLDAGSKPNVSSRLPLAGDTPPTGAIAVSERRQVTILASTLAGYDALIEQLMPDVLAGILAAIHAEARGVAARHGGVLNQYTGDQLVLLFGVPVTREDDAVRAARAALEMHARVTAVAARPELLEAPPALHSGIDTGLVVTQPAEDGVRVFRVSGSTSHAAARLAEHAGPDEIWLSAETRKRITPFFETEARNALTLGDRKQPLVPYRLIRETGLQARIEFAERAELTAFIGRDAELAMLRRYRERLDTDGGRLVLVTGEAGVGKSRLLHELRYAPAEPELSVFVARCQSYGGDIAYLPFIDLLRNGLGIGTGGLEHAVAQIRSISPTLEEFIPLFLNLLSIPSSAHPMPRHLQGDAFRMAMQEALAAILTLNAQRRPSVTVFEDWHWADEASQAVLREISEVLPAHPLLVLVTSRPDYGVESGLPERISQIALKPLEQVSTGAMLRALLGADVLPEELVPLIQQRTGGNPFFIEEICRALLEDGSLRTERGAALLAAPLVLREIPDSIQAVIRSRLDRLEPDARDLLRLAAVTGVEFAGAVIKAAFPDRSDLTHTLNALKVAGLVQQTRLAPFSEYRFNHVLTQEVAYASLLEHQRRELHGRVGGILERLHGGADDQLDRLAHHFSRANAWLKAVQYGLLSAQRADRLAQYPEALLILERTQKWTLHLAPGPERDSAVIDILLQQERLCETLGQRTRQQQLIDQVIALLGGYADRARLAEAWLRQGDLHTLLRRFAEAEEPLQRALRLRRELGDRVGERNTLRSLGLLRWYEGRNLEALELAQQTLRIARERGDVSAVVADLTNCGGILRALGDHEGARLVLEEALATGHPGGADSGAVSDELAIKHVYALQNLSHCYREAGDRGRALECLQRAGAIAAQKRLPIALSYHYTSMAHLHLQDGRIAESLASYREAIELTRKARYAPGLAQSLRIYGEVLVGLDMHGEALPCLQEAAATFAELRDAHGEGSVWSAVAAIEESRQHSAAALVAWGKACALWQQLEDRVGELVAVEGLARTTRVQLPGSPLALAYYERGVHLAHELADGAAEGRMRNVLGILEWEKGAYAEALGHYERAFELFSALSDDTHAGLMLNSIGATLRLLDRGVEAEQRLRDGLQLHERSGQKQLEAHALALIGDVLADRDDVEDAIGHYSRSLQIRRAIGDRKGEGWMLHSVARCELARGEPYRIREHLIAATRLADECGDAELAGACQQLRRAADH